MTNTNEGIETELNPLPTLPVIRDTYCPQEMTDTIVSYLENNCPEVLQTILQTLSNRLGDYYSAFSSAVYLIKTEISSQVEVPNSPLGYIDLTFELSRRLHKLEGLKEPEIIGKPIAPDIEGPFIPLSDKDLYPRSEKLGFSQADLDEALATFYEEKPEWWYLTGEALRRDQGLYIYDDVENSYFDKLISKFISPENNMHKGNLRHQFKIEATDRVRLMCKIALNG